MEQEMFEEFDKYDFENDTSFQTGWSAIASVINPSNIGIEYLRAKIFFYSKHCKQVDLKDYVMWKKRKSMNSDQAKQTEGDDAATNYPDDLCAPTSGGTEASAEALSPNTPKGNNITTDVTETCLDSLSNLSCDDNISNLSHSTLLAQEESKTTTEDSVNNDLDLKTCEDKDEEQKENCDSTKKDEISSLADTEEGLPLSLLDIATHIQNGIPIPGLLTLDVQPTNLDPTPSSCARKLKPWELNGEEKVDS